MLYLEPDRVKTLRRQLESFMDRYVYPNEDRFYKRSRGTQTQEVFTQSEF